MGNKTSILHILYALFPLNYERYIEPFGGSGAVLLGKKKPDKFEVYNDFNHNLVNLFRCMRDRPNIEDFLIQNVKEYTKPLFSIPTHHFLFYPGNINPKDFEDALMVEPNEYALIKFGERGTCLYRCGNERYLLLVQAPEYKAEIFGSAGGR